MSLNVVKFFREVRQEADKITWPTRKDTLASLLMVVIMVAISAVFFLLVDWVVSSSIAAVLGV